MLSRVQNAKELTDEPVRDCLLGIPGAGKSTCIKLMRRFFEECLGWENGVQFQFLASQNTMAALIGGQTLHSWGVIPLNATDAANKLQNKGKDDDIDQLFLNALGIRWLVIDEVSTISPCLLGLLDSYLRRACCRHPYAKSHGRKRPFGGINMVFAGDFWQLPPVRALSIFSNPFKKGVYDTLEQKMLMMFWKRGDSDSIQKTWVLDQSMRTQDKWLKSVLDADRYGEESWEMYCFIHGLPTRNVGTWDPETGEPSCKNVKCAGLAAGPWSELWRRGKNDPQSWMLRLDQECPTCQAERKRRCCVLRDTDEDRNRYATAPFDLAPYVHPFRHPSYHATQLRALLFAKSMARRLMWVRAHDKVTSNNLNIAKETEDLRKEKWLILPDRKTGGIPGLLPLVIGLPIRFTENLGPKAKEMGVFKHARGMSI